MPLGVLSARYALHLYLLRLIADADDDNDTLGEITEAEKEEIFVVFTPTSVMTSRVCSCTCIAAPSPSGIDWQPTSAVPPTRPLTCSRRPQAV